MSKIGLDQVFRRSTWIAGEQGGSTVIWILALTTLLLFVTPFFLNAASLYTTRRTSQNAADAAALAAAETYSEGLTWHRNINFHRSYYDPKDDGCVRETEPRSKMEDAARKVYIKKVYGQRDVMHKSRAKAEAERFASINNTQVVKEGIPWIQCAEDCEAIKDGDLLPFIVAVITERPYVPAIASMFGEPGMPIKAHAAAVVYLRDSLKYREQDECRDKQEWDATLKRTVKWYRLKVEAVWEVHLIDYQGPGY